MSATEELARYFNAVSDYLALAVLANRRDGLDRAFKAVEYVPLSGSD